MRRSTAPARSEYCRELAMALLASAGSEPFYREVCQLPDPPPPKLIAFEGLIEQLTELNHSGPEWWPQ